MISIGMMNITYMCHGQVTLWIFHGVMAIPSEWIYPYGLMTTPKKMYFSWKTFLVGGSNHLEKYESQWEGLSHILWKIKNVPNHQRVFFIQAFDYGTYDTHQHTINEPKNHKIIEVAHYFIITHFGQAFCILAKDVQRRTTWRPQLQVVVHIFWYSVPTKKKHVAHLAESY